MRLKDVIIKATYFSNLIREREESNVMFKNINIQDVVSWLRINKFSSEILTSIYGSGEAVLNKYVVEDRQHVKIWLNLLSHISSALNSGNVAYTVIKYYDIPHILMLDIDLMIADPCEIIKASEILSSLGFKLYDFRFFSHPWKLGAKLPRLESDIAVEIYPGLYIGRLLVGPSEEFLKKSTNRTILGVNVRALPPEENIYSLITHDWFSRHIPLSLIVYAIKLHERKLKWDKVLEYAKEWETIQSVYTILILADRYSRSLGLHDMDFNEILRSIDKFLGKRKIDVWLERASLSFPIRVPLKLLLMTSFYHLKKVCSISVKECLNNSYGYFSLLTLALWEKL